MGVKVVITDEGIGPRCFSIIEEHVPGLPQSLGLCNQAIPNCTSTHPNVNSVREYAGAMRFGF